MVKKANFLDFADRIRQYLCLPMLKPEDFLDQLRRLKAEVLDSFLPANILERYKAFHKYVLTFWCGTVGPKEISVAGLDHRTNNAVESLHARMRKFLPCGTTLFLYLKSLTQWVIEMQKVFINQKDYNPTTNTSATVMSRKKRTHLT